jgi:hypothetical protein
MKMRAHSFKPKCMHPQTSEGKCSRTKPSGVCLGLEAVAEARRYTPSKAESPPHRVAEMRSQASI